MTSLTARLRVGDFTKSLRVTGDRLWTRAPGARRRGADRPFVQLPLRYERAPLSPTTPSASTSTRRPRSAPPRAPTSTASTARAPRQSPCPRASIPPGRPGSTPPPLAAVGFGPIAPTWRARRKLLDDTGLFWAYGVAGRDRRAAGPAPPGFDFAFFNTAPRDQQTRLAPRRTPRRARAPQPDAPAPRHAVPAIRPQVFRVDPRAGRAEEIILRCDTLWIDADRELMVLTFRGIADAAGGDESAVGKLVVVADPFGKKLRWERVEKMLREGGAAKVRTAPGLGKPGAPDDEPAPPDPLARRYNEVLEPAKKPGLDDEPTHPVRRKPPG